MKITVSQLRRVIREVLEETEVNQSEFTYAIAKAAEKGEDTVDIDGEKFPVKMSKDKAKQITKESLERVSDTELLDAFEEIYMEKGDVTVEELASTLAMPTPVLSRARLAMAGLTLQDDGSVTDY